MKKRGTSSCFGVDVDVSLPAPNFVRPFKVVIVSVPISRT